MRTVDDLVTWLRAQLDDDERVAREALHPDAVTPGVWTTEHHNSEHHSEPNRCHIAEDRSGQYWTVAHEVFIPNAEHMARWDPARVLAEVERTRKLIRRYELVAGASTALVSFTRGQDDGYRQACEDAIRDAAEVYADRPGYRDEWRP